MVCIYCSEPKDGSAFNREHVLPEAFGSFRDSLVLHERVCSECNGFFGRELDLILARSSSEGLERYPWHVRPAEEVERFRYGDVLVRLDAPGTEWDRALVRKVPTEVLGESQIELVPQAVFRTVDGGVRHVPLWELRRGGWRTDADLDLPAGIHILAPADLYDDVVAVLVAHGVQFEAHAELTAPQPEDGEMDVTHSFALTPQLRRAVAKIAFNYLAYVGGREAALRPEFDDIREFIRYGRSTDYERVNVVPTTRLGMVTEEGRVPVVHYVTLEYDASRTALLAYVTLFHWVVYQVVLSPEAPSDLDVELTGHLFNLKDMTCRELKRASRDAL